MEDIDGGLHPAVDGQSLDEMRLVTRICAIGRVRPSCRSPSFCDNQSEKHAAADGGGCAAAAVASDAVDAATAEWG